MRNFTPMKKSILITCFMLGAFLTSVAFTPHSHYDKFVKSEYGYSVSKIVDGNVDYVFSPANMEPYHVDYQVSTVCPCYKAGEINNRALPLSKKIWLLNCQIALK